MIYACDVCGYIFETERQYFKALAEEEGIPYEKSV